MTVHSQYQRPAIHIQQVTPALRAGSVHFRDKLFGNDTVYGDPACVAVVTVMEKSPPQRRMIRK